MRRSKGWQAPHTGADHHEKDNVQLAQRYDQIVADYEKGNSKNSGRRQHNAEPAQPAQPETEKVNGKTEAKKPPSTPTQALGTPWHCWVCKEQHPSNSFCDAITNDPARALKAWPAYLSRKYDITEEQIVKTKMPTSFEELLQLWKDLRPLKKRCGPTAIWTRTAVSRPEPDTFTKPRTGV